MGFETCSFFVAINQCQQVFWKSYQLNSSNKLICYEITHIFLSQNSIITITS